MELEALLLGLEPLTALGIGLGSLVLAPIVGIVGSGMGANSPVGNSLTESSRNLAKTGLVWALDTAEKTQTFFAETGELVQDLVADAKNELNAQKSEAARSEAAHESSPREVEIK